jgi:hypothetical protein
MPTAPFEPVVAITVAVLYPSADPVLGGYDLLPARFCNDTPGEKRKPSIMYLNLGILE